MAESDIHSVTELEDIFNKAAKHLQSLASKLNNSQLLVFYGLYKQATVGPCNIPRPNWYQTQAKQKWEAWKNLGDMDREEAMSNYIHALTTVDPTWSENTNTKSYAWVAVSQLPKTDAELCDAEKTFLDWVKEGNEVKVLEFLKEDVTFANVPDEDGLLPIHWAADRGHTVIIRHLIEAGTCVDALDIDGQTPLHYAASCGHLEAAEYLLSIGAGSVKDNSGMTPKDVADEKLIAIFQ